jgi:uncharacterized protein
MTQTLTPSSPQTATTQKFPVIDTDVHQTLGVTDEQLLSRLPSRWRRHLEMFGIRNVATERQIAPQREFTHRLDAIDPSGRPAVLPDFTREQLVDAFDMSGVVLANAIAVTHSRGGGNFPEQLAVELARAYNDAHRELWIAADPRFYVSINVAIEDPAAAVAEIVRCKDGPDGDRFVSVVVDPRGEYPRGNPKYWPVYEVCEQYNLPLTMHTAPGRRLTPQGSVNYYFEWHVGFPLRNYTVAASMIFEGVFERFPQFRVGLIEQGWAWAVPFAWRLDRAWSILREEVPQLTRKPSEYFRDSFWFATQPMEEPEDMSQLGGLLSQFESLFGPNRLMYSSDYPHWDFDSPFESVPQYLPADQRRRILGETASAFFGIPLLPDSGIQYPSGGSA